LFEFSIYGLKIPLKTYLSQAYLGYHHVAYLYHYPATTGGRGVD
jgi:hypothetical protein